MTCIPKPAYEARPPGSRPIKRTAVQCGVRCLERELGKGAENGSDETAPRHCFYRRSNGRPLFVGFLRSSSHLSHPAPNTLSRAAACRADIKGIRSAGTKVHAASRETADLCVTTVAKAEEVVAFGLELRETLDGLSEADGKTMDASKFEVIRDLVDGDRIREATGLASELGGLALRCVDKSREFFSPGAFFIGDEGAEARESSLVFIRGGGVGGRWVDPTGLMLHLSWLVKDIFVSNFLGASLYWFMSLQKTNPKVEKAEEVCLRGLFAWKAQNTC